MTTGSPVHSPHPNRSAKQRLVWWLAFIGTTVALSEAFRVTRDITSESAKASPLAFLLWVGVLAFGLTVLAYDSYMSSKAEGKLHRRIAVFEQFQSYWTREKQR